MKEPKGHSRRSAATTRPSQQVTALAGLFRDIPSNHSPHFAPLIEPTLSTGVEAMTIAALTWLSAENGATR